MSKQMEARLLSFFAGNPEAFAVQKPSGNYVPARRPITAADIRAHLDGKWTVGIYVMAAPTCVWFAAIDIDDYVDAKLRAVQVEAHNFGMRDEHLLLEDSGNKGRHIFFRFAELTSARTARALCGMLLEKAGLANQGIEIFPKQDALPEEGGLGNLIKLPLGIHRKSGRRSEFLGWDLKPRAAEHIGSIDTVPAKVLRVAAAWHPPVAERSPRGLLPASPPTTITRHVPCIRRIEHGVKDGARNVACFAMAIYLCNIKCLQPEEALIMIRDWNALNEPPLPDNVLVTNVRNAFDRGFTWVNCKDPLMKAKFCSEKCERRRAVDAEVTRD